MLKWESFKCGISIIAVYPLLIRPLHWSYVKLDFLTTIINCLYCTACAAGGVYADAHLVPLGPMSCFPICKQLH